MNILSATVILGGIWLVILFVLCFLTVHTPSILQKRRTNKEVEEPPPEPKQTEVEPVYYIVEKKKKRVKDTYSTPKQIHFK